MSSEQVEDTFHGKNGKIYAAYVVENPEDLFNSRPLCAALLMTNPKDLRYDKIKFACQSNGRGLLTNLILDSTMELTMSALKEQFDYHYNIRLNAFRKASKIKCSSIPLLDSGIILGSSFIGKAINRGILCPETAAKCGLNSSTHSQETTRKVTNLGYTLNVSQNGSTSEDGVMMSTAGNSSNAEVFIEDESRKKSDPNNIKHDPVQFAMSSSGIHFDDSSVGAFVTVSDSQDPTFSSDITKPSSHSQASSTNVYGSDNSSSRVDGGMDIEDSIGDAEVNNIPKQGHPDDDQLIDDVLLQVDDLDAEIKNHPVFKAMCNALKCSKRTIAQKNERIQSLLRLAMLAEDQMNAIRKSQTNDLIEGIKSALDNSKNDITKAVSEDMKSSFDNLNFAISKVNAKLVALKISSKKIDDTTTIMDNKLSVSGFVVKTNPLEQVDVPEVLLQVNNKVNGSPFSFPPPPTPFFPGPSPDAIPPHHHLKWTPEGKKSHYQTSSTWPRSSLKVGLSSNASVTPLHRLPPTSSSQLTPAPTPREKVRWSESAHASSTTNQSATRPASARSLSKQLNSCGSPYTDDSQRRFNVMTKAKENLHADNTAYSQEEIKKRANQYEKNLKKNTRR